MENTCLVSVLLPTRGRVDKLRSSLDSLENTVMNPENVEVLIKVDDDDIETINYVDSMTRKFRFEKIVGPRGGGYSELHNMYNRLCAHSRGRFLFLWNDDALMLTPCWDVELIQHDDGKLCYVISGVNDVRGTDSFLFPIVHRKWYELTGHFSMSAHNDTYVYQAFSKFPHLFRKSAIIIKHHALELLSNQDKTSVEGRNWWSVTKQLWDSEMVQGPLRQDIELIKNNT
jgi:hypothetical protein